MADPAALTDIQVALDIHRNEARNARLKALADSINDTARMARNTLTAALLVSLYLGVTLISSTDENLFRNGQVVLPQVGVGVSVVQSYIFAPPLFVFLHVQALFLLNVLAGKVRAYRDALEDEEVPEGRRREYWNWLSAFAFVQVFERQHSVWHPSRLLTWLTTNVVPLALLFAIDVSFVRYQSLEITWVHHGLFLADLVAIAWFNSQTIGGGWRLWRDRLFLAPSADAGDLRAIDIPRRSPVEVSAASVPSILWVGAFQLAALFAAFTLLEHAQPPLPDADEPLYRQTERVQKVDEQGRDVWIIPLEEYRNRLHR